MNVEQVLRTFAELSREPGDIFANVLRHDYDFQWIQSSAEALFRGEPASAVAFTTSRKDGILEQGKDEPKVDRLIGAGSLHQTEQLLRVGWFWIAGRLTNGDETTSYCFPLLSVPVRRTKSAVAKVRGVTQAFKSGVLSVDRVLEPVGDIELTGLIGEAARAELLGEIAREDIGAFRSWRERAVEATGLDVEEWATPDSGKPGVRAERDGLTAFVGVGLYLERAAAARTPRQALLDLALASKKGQSVVHTIYEGKRVSEGEPTPLVQVRPLTARQEVVAVNAVASELSVISGAPGNGKTHVLSSIAINAVANGKSVLVVGSTRYATDVLLDHLAEIGSVQPIAFGSSRHRERLASQFEPTKPASTTSLDQAEQLMLDTRQQLAIEREAYLYRCYPNYVAARTTQLERAGDLEELGGIIDRYFLPRPADLFRDNGSTIEERLDLDLSEIRPGHTDHVRAELEHRLRDCEVIEAALRRSIFDTDAAELNREEIARLSSQGSELQALWVHQAFLESRTATDELGNRLQQTLRLGNRSERARELKKLEPGDLKVGLWVGAVEDIDTLPLFPGAFDIVIIDEAAQVSQLAAAGALLRAKAAILCGDPQQLRHQLDLSSDQVMAAAAMFGTDPDVLDVAAHSVLDIAASKVPAQLLDEHFRSAPHLIEFSNRRFYGGELKTTTRHPSNEAADHIHVQVISGQQRDSDGVNVAEAVEALSVAEQYIAKGWRSIGFLSPFEEQAEFLEQMILDEYSLEQIENYGLRVGTVRAFQGDERDVMILSWAIGSDEDDSEWDVVNQDALFNVMVTRARHQIVVVTSNPTPPGLAGEYVRWSEPLSDLEVDQPASSPWVETLVRKLEERSIPTRTGYRVGTHLIDLVVGTGKNAVAIDCVPHVDGPDALIERMLILRRSGWRTSEAFETSWEHRPDELADELLRRFDNLADTPAG